MAAWYSRNQNGGLQNPGKTYFVLCINEEKSETVYRLRFHTKIRKKGGVGVAELFVQGGDLCLQQVRGGERKRVHGLSNDILLVFLAGNGNSNSYKPRASIYSTYL